jgi:endonuclease YncB( thermonuclease family)
VSRLLAPLLVLVCGLALSAAPPAAPPPSAAPAPALVLPCRILDAHDGDTATVEVRLVLRVRLRDCWAPEVRGGNAETKRAGLASRDHLRGLLRDETPDTLRIDLSAADRLDDVLSLGRVVGDLWDGTTDLAAAQVAAGHATRAKP